MLTENNNVLNSESNDVLFSENNDVAFSDNKDAWFNSKNHHSLIGAWSEFILKGSKFQVQPVNNDAENSVNKNTEFSVTMVQSFFDYKDVR